VSAPGLLGTSLPEALLRGAGSAPARAAFGTLGTPTDWSHTELCERYAAVAAGFARRGIGPGDRVLIRVSSEPDDVLALLGLLHLGAVPVSVKPRVPGIDDSRYLAEVAHLQDARYAHRMDVAGTVPVDLEPVPGAAPPPAVPAPEDIALVQYTSGSTGTPRAIPLSHRAVLANIAAIRSESGMGTGSTGLIVVPLHHDMGLVGLFTCLTGGIDLVLERTAVFLRKPLAVLQQTAGAEALHVAFPDFMLRYLAARIEAAQARGALPSDLMSSWSTVFCGAEAIRRTTVRTFLTAAGPLGLRPGALLFCYGLAEASLMATAHRFVDDRTSFEGDLDTGSACLGRPIPGLELLVAGPDGRPCADGEVGAVRLRGSTLFSGYDGATDHTVEWFDTGDLGRLRSGRLHLSGRRADRVSVGGVNVFVTDVEDLVLRMDGVSDCVVLPNQDTFDVLLVADTRRQLVLADVAARVTGTFGVAPGQVRTVPRQAVVRTASGKPARAHMLEQLRQGVPG